jgi:hypothetical protein
VKKKEENLMEQIGINDLKLFPEYDRVSYEAKFGVQAPPADPTKPVKAWLDVASGAPYYQLVMSNPPRIVPLAVSPDEANVVNLTGQYRYPAYEVLPTLAVMVWGNLRPLASAATLSSEAEANTLGAELGVVPSIPPFETTGIKFEWRGETRRNWEVVVNGAQYNVQTLLQTKSVAGVGAPGKWVKDDVGSLAWKPLPQPQPIAGSSVPVPVRLLAANQEFSPRMGGTWVVVEKGSDPMPAPASDTGEILRLVTAIAKTLGIQ